MYIGPCTICFPLQPLAFITVSIVMYFSTKPWANVLYPLSLVAGSIRPVLSTYASFLPRRVPLSMVYDVFIKLNRTFMNKIRIFIVHFQLTIVKWSKSIKGSPRGLIWIIRNFLYIEFNPWPGFLVYLINFRFNTIVLIGKTEIDRAISTARKVYFDILHLVLSNFRL